MLAPEQWVAVRLSLQVALLALCGALPVALLLGWLLSRGRWAGRPLLDLLVHLPMVLPPVVTGWLLLLLFGLHGPAGALLWRGFGARLVFTQEGAALATGVMTLPLMVRTVRLAFDAVDPRLEQAAASLGAGRLDRLLTITLPLAAPGVLAAAAIGYAASLGEFGAVIVFAGNIPGRTQTLPLAIYQALQVPGGEAVAARLALVSLGLALAGLVVAELLLRRLPRAGGAG